MREATYGQACQSLLQCKALSTKRASENAAMNRRHKNPYLVDKTRQRTSPEEVRRGQSLHPARPRSGLFFHLHFSAVAAAGPRVCLIPPGATVTTMRSRDAEVSALSSPVVEEIGQCVSNEQQRLNQELLLTS